jgi:uncharacterized membrane protein AbrB (regulator of aidB expression)
MIPTVILIGALVRRWWIVPAAALLWPLALVFWEEIDGIGGLVGPGLLAALNVAFGAIVGTAFTKVAGGLRAAANARS